MKDHNGEGHERYKRRLATHAREAAAAAAAGGGGGGGGGCLITKVIGISKLKAKYKQFEARRKLRESYDLFVVDDRVVQMMPQLLGKTFFKCAARPPARAPVRRRVLRELPPLSAPRARR